MHTDTLHTHTDTDADLMYMHTDTLHSTYTYRHTPDAHRHTTYTYRHTPDAHSPGTAERQEKIGLDQIPSFAFLFW